MVKGKLLISRHRLWQWFFHAAKIKDSYSQLISKNCAACLQPLYEMWHLSLKFETFKTEFMKRILLIAFASGLFTFSYAQTGHENHNHDAPATTPVAKTEESLKFKEAEHDFSKIPQGKPVYYEFEIVNISTAPLKLENVTATCGCTTPIWNRDPIAPGASAIIKVGYNAAAEGYFEKFITVTYNTNQTKQLKIKGTVWKAPEGSAPVNTSVDFLKKQSL